MDFPTRKLPVTRIWYEMMNNEPMVSVIVLTYNHEKYIEQALNSILMQNTGFAIEILVGDDASTDCTPQILREYQKQYPDIIKLFLKEKNEGATNNAYPLFYKARGAYIATCEGDDYWCDASKLKTQVDFLENHPEFIGCAHPCVRVNESGEEISDEPLNWECTKQVMTIQDFKGHLLPGQAATIVRRNLYKSNLNIDFSVYHKAHPFIGDRTTGLIYLSQGNFYRMNKAMSAYRVVTSETSMTVKLYHNNKNWIKEDYEYTKKLESYAKEQLSIFVDFEPYYQQLLELAFVAWVKTPRREMFDLIFRILNNCRKQIKSVILLFWKMLRKALKRIRI